MKAISDWADFHGLWVSGLTCDVKASETAVAMADQLAADDRDATIMWLRWSGVGQHARRTMAHRLMVGSVFAQAGVLGLVECTRCGDQGCEWCAPGGLVGRE